MMRAAILLLASTGIAQADLSGTWCNDAESVHIDAYGIGFNEHTICDVKNLPVQMDANDQWASKVSCRNVYVTEIKDDGTVTSHDIPVEGLTHVKFVGAADGTLFVTTDLRDEEMHFLPCD